MRAGPGAIRGADAVMRQALGPGPLALVDPPTASDPATIEQHDVQAMTRIVPSGQRVSSSSSPESIRAVIVRFAVLACGMPAWRYPEVTCWLTR